MARAVDADIFIRDLTAMKKMYDAIELDGMIKALKEAPTIDTVKHGEWVRSDIPCEKYYCSVCGGACWHYDYNGDVVRSKYCPNCGSKMDGE